MKRFAPRPHYLCMKAFLGLLLALCAAAPLAAATCPFNIPVVTIPPQQINGYSWGSVIRPMNDACVSAIAVEPANASEWYAGSQTALYRTTNAGATWTTAPIGGPVTALLMTHDSGLQLVYAGVGTKLWLTKDHGANWNVIHTFGATVQSLLVANGTLYVGQAWSTHAVPSGIWTSNLGGGLGQFHPFGAGQTGLIVHTLARDPLSGAVYAGTEIFDHLPQPYHPPFFRSDNNGMTWTNVAGTLPWHVVASAVRPTDGWVYALTEGAGLFVSANKGATWHPLANNPAPSDSLLMDAKVPTRLFGGRQKSGNIPGGIFVSTNAGQTFTPIGLQGATVAGLAMNGAGTRIYAAVYASGIYVSPVP
jgi:photosystem II stability/assembly factor-like uncharacterized protein